MVLWEEHHYVTVISPKITAARVFFPPSRENMEKYSITRGREHSCSIFRALLKKYRDFFYQSCWGSWSCFFWASAAFELREEEQSHHLVDPLHTTWSVCQLFTKAQRWRNKSGLPQRPVQPTGWLHQIWKLHFMYSTAGKPAVLYMKHFWILGCQVWN